MPTLPHHPVSFLFGSVDKHAGTKAIPMGNLRTAKNVQRVHEGEIVPRGGMTAATATFVDTANSTSATSITAADLCSPDGTTKIVRDTFGDRAYVATGSAGVAYTSRSQSRATPRLLATQTIRFPSKSSTQQVAPQAKQAGDWYVWMEDEEHFRYAQQSTDGTRLLRQSASIAVAGPTAGSGTSTHVKSFCVVNTAAFDENNVWVYWVDWTWNVAAQQNRDAVWAMKLPKDWSAPTQMVISSGTASNLYILTGITATYVDSALWLAQCGIYLQTGSAVAFRSNSFGAGYGFSQHFSVNSAGSPSALGTYLRTSTARSWVASGITMLTTEGRQEVDGTFRYAFWTKHPTDRKLADLVLVSVLESDRSSSAVTVDSVDLASTIAPTLLTADHTFVGQVTGREDGGGAFLAASVRVSATNDGTSEWADVDTFSADRVFTRGYGVNTGTATKMWEKRGAWLAHGLVSIDSIEYIITGWQDRDDVQKCYHLRRLTNGAITCEFAYGEAAYNGGCGLPAGQIELHAADLQQPYLTAQPYSESAPSVLLATASANVAGAVEISHLEIARPTYYQPPVGWSGFALAPGGIPTIVGGWQDEQEAGPLTAPSTPDSTWQIGELSPLYGGAPITDGDVGVSVRYRITDAKGNLWRSAPSPTALLLKDDSMNGVSMQAQIIRIPTLRHLMEGTTAQIELYIGSVDLQLFRVFENDPEVDYIDVIPQAPLGWEVGDPSFTLQTITAILAAAPTGETLDTTGGGIPADPPPQFRCLTAWRNRIIGAFGNRIYPSMEFESGMGVKWTAYTSIAWEEGTGDILAICPIDWNYCAIFKEDAIGVISGPGPDGMAHGNYIVQTLPTRMGCNNPLSVVNGSNGAYFQDKTTKRICVVTPQLGPVEALNGWFNEDGDDVCSAMQVEESRQVWFATRGQEIIVLDYKHKSETSPVGEVYVWDTSAFAQDIVGMAIVGGVPTMLLADGTTLTYSALATSDTLTTAQQLGIATELETGEMQPAGVQGMVDVCKVQLLGEYVSRQSITITVYPQFATSGTSKTLEFTTAPAQLLYRPANCQRIQSVRAKVATVPAYTYTDRRMSILFTSTGGYLNALTAGSIILSVTLVGVTSPITQTLGYATIASRCGASNSAWCYLDTALTGSAQISAVSLQVVTPLAGTAIAACTARASREGYESTSDAIWNAGEVNVMTSATYAGTPTGTPYVDYYPTPVAGIGFKLNGIGLDVQAHGKLQHLSTGRIV